MRRRLAALVLLVVVAVTAVRTEPGSLTHGTGVLVLVSMMVVLVGGGALLFGLPARRPWAEPAVVGLVMLGSLLLAWFEPNGVGYFGAFIIASALAFRSIGRRGPLVAGLFLVAIGVVAVVAAHRPVVNVLLNELGAVAFFRLGLYANRLEARTAESERLVEELRETRQAQVRAATLAERQRLAREMHDVLAHSLSGLVLQLEGARLLAATDPADPRLNDALDRAHHLAQAGLGEARQAIGTLRDDELPGPERLRALAAEFERDTGIACCYTVSGEPKELAADTRLTVYRVAQEALTNVRKHAEARQVELRLGYRPDQVVLTVEDFGTPARREDTGQGYGVTGMRERAELAGGTLAAEPTGAGFRVTLRVPA
ncbi:sensor histidine kinase [Amycolatopsis acidicola]|uniref:histidine kinase n=2 Tax=Amycolatopsis acidicola TaxID=2596893 RepID=A0A5N0UM24_9PSEU|nr:sensor histidine kinase [Amycolatopsis acidicola]